MKIEIKEIKNQLEFYDEAYGILRLYNKKLYNKPNRKIYTLSDMCLIYCANCVLSILSILVLGFIYKFNYIIFILLGIVVMCSLIGISGYVQTKKMIHRLIYRKIDTIIEIDDKKVSMENKIIGQKNELLWENINYILISKYVIGFMPKKSSYSQSAIFCSIDYINDITKVIEKYKKDNLVVKNNK